MKKIASYGGLFFGVAALSTSAIFVKIAEAPSGVTAFYRLFFALLILLPAVVFQKKRREEIFRMERKKMAAAVLSGLLLAIHFVLWFESLHYTSVASSTVLVTLQPLFTILFSFLFLKERQNHAAMAGCMIAVFGSFVIGYGDFSGGWKALFGDLMALSAAVFISLYFFIGQFLRKEMSATVYTALGYAGSVLFLGIYVLLKQDSFTGYPGSTWKAFLGIAVISTILGQFIFNLLLKWLPATSISMSIIGEPVGTCILAYFILNETISLQQGIGMTLILGGLILYFLSVPVLERWNRRKEKHQPETV